MAIDRIDLTSVESEVRAELDAKYAARELAIRLARPIIQHSSKAIRALHRNDEGLAREFLNQIKSDLDELNTGLVGQEDIARSGLVYDAVKEYAEAELTAALLSHQPLPLPSDLGIHAVPYLKGLGEAVGEQRDDSSTQLRLGQLDEAERTFCRHGAGHRSVDGTRLSRRHDVGTQAHHRCLQGTHRAVRADLTSTIVQERLRADLAGD